MLSIEIKKDQKLYCICYFTTRNGLVQKSHYRKKTIVPNQWVISRLLRSLCLLIGLCISRAGPKQLRKAAQRRLLTRAVSVCFTCCNQFCIQKFWEYYKQSRSVLGHPHLYSVPISPYCTHRKVEILPMPLFPLSLVTSHALVEICKNSRDLLPGARAGCSL